MKVNNAQQKLVMLHLPQTGQRSRFIMQHRRPRPSLSVMVLTKNLLTPKSPNCKMFYDILDTKKLAQLTNMQLLNNCKIFFLILV